VLCFKDTGNTRGHVTSLSWAIPHLLNQEKEENLKEGARNTFAVYQTRAFFRGGRERDRKPPSEESSCDYGGALATASTTPKKKRKVEGF